MSEKIHLRGDKPGTAYCGRRDPNPTTRPKQTTCADCLAALRADQEATR